MVTKELLLFAIVLACASCVNKQERDVTEFGMEDTEMVVCEETDMVVGEEMEKNVEPETKEEQTKDARRTTTGVSVSSSGSTVRSSGNSCRDNMRGFDPASEDDMDDNGLSRFMENNDDEGWD